MTEPITYRRATSDDILTICELGQILNQVHHQARPDMFANATSEFARDTSHWLPSLSGDDRAAFLAQQGATAIGFITAQIIRAQSPLSQPMVVGRIGSICVKEHLQGRGVGRALMRCAEQWATANGANDLRLSVWAFNERAARLYRKLGYEIRLFDLGKSMPVEG